MEKKTKQRTMWIQKKQQLTIRDTKNKNARLGYKKQQQRTTRIQKTTTHDPDAKNTTTTDDPDAQTIADGPNTKNNRRSGI